MTRPVLSFCLDDGWSLGASAALNPKKAWPGYGWVGFNFPLSCTCKSIYPPRSDTPPPPNNFNEGGGVVSSRDGRQVPCASPKLIRPLGRIHLRMVYRRCKYIRDGTSPVGCSLHCPMVYALKGLFPIDKYSIIYAPHIYHDCGEHIICLYKDLKTTAPATTVHGRIFC